MLILQRKVIERKQIQPKTIIYNKLRLVKHLVFSSIYVIFSVFLLLVLLLVSLFFVPLHW